VQPLNNKEVKETDPRDPLRQAGNCEPLAALLGFAVFQIGDAEQSRVVKDCKREFEGNPMLAHIRGCLDLVPFELKLPPIRNPSSRTQG
jgi:hypothetical protein